MIRTIVGINCLILLKKIWVKLAPSVTLRGGWISELNVTMTLSVLGSVQCCQVFHPICPIALLKNPKIDISKIQRYHNTKHRYAKNYTI